MFYDQLDLDTPIVNYNGSLVTNPKDKNYEITDLTITKEAMIDIFETQKEYICNAFGEVRDNIYLYKDTERIRPLLHYFNGGELIVGEFKDTLKNDPNGFIIVSKKNVGHNIEDYINKTYSENIRCRNWGTSQRHIIEVFTKDTCKGNAVKKLLNDYNMTSDDLIAIGDAGNDIEMLKLAKHAVVMRNAEDFVKEHATHITKYTNADQGVLHFLKNFFE